MKRTINMALATLALFISQLAFAEFKPDLSSSIELDVARAILNIKERDPAIQRFFDNSAGYAVFPSVGKGGIIVGGAYGRGLVIIDDKVDGRTTMSQADRKNKPHLCSIGQVCFAEYG